MDVDGRIQSIKLPIQTMKCNLAMSLAGTAQLLRKAEKYVKIAELYLEDRDPVAADTFCSRAAMVMHEAGSGRGSLRPFGC